MKKKVSEYIAQLLIDHNIHNIFTVVGGGAMHLNDSFGNHPEIRCLYNHHEQASAMAAESYARINNDLAVTCVTTGPGGTNAITGVLCAWQDSIPMLVLSGQVRYSTTVESTGLSLRQFGEQEHYIIKTVKDITKYAVTIKDPLSIKYHIEKAVYLATHGRRGPCWIDIPLDVQGAIIDTNDLLEFTPAPISSKTFDLDTFKSIIQNSNRPVILAGHSLRISGAYSDFLQLIDELKIPVLATTSSADLLPYTHKYYFGNYGVFGGRPGNFIVQNADCLIALGCRMSFKQTGFNFEAFSPHSKKIVVDIDSEELKKKTVSIDLPIHMDLTQFIPIMKKMHVSFPSLDSEWLSYCIRLKKAFPCCREDQKSGDGINPYHFSQTLQCILPDDSITVLGNNCSCVAALQCGIPKQGQRLWGNTNCGTMGYDLPASIGAAVASGKRVVCITGDGSLQMNLQELQTIVHNKLPIKIFVFNNGGYQAIVQTHTNFFGRLTGCTKETGISFPSFERLSYAYDIPYFKCEKNADLQNVLIAFLQDNHYGICELIENRNQAIEPKLKSKAIGNGQFISPPIDDLAPFLDKETYQKYSIYPAQQKEV